MTTAATPAHDPEPAATTRRARSSRPGPRAGRSAPAPRTPRRRPAGEIHTSRGDHEGTELTPGDYGLFGPGSATWQLMGEPILWVAGIRALYLQALDPKTMLGTWQNSALAHRHEAWARFLPTTEFVRTRTYGSTPEAERAGRRVRTIHASLTGTDADGTVFRLDEAEQLLWMHCAKVDSYVAICRRCGTGATPGQLDEFVGEQRRPAALAGLDPATVPASVAEQAPSSRRRVRSRADLIRRCAPHAPHRRIAAGHQPTVGSWQADAGILRRAAAAPAARSHRGAWKPAPPCS